MESLETCKSDVVAIITREQFSSVTGDYYTTWHIDIPVSDPLFQQLLEKYGNAGVSVCGTALDTIAELAQNL